MTKIRSDVLLMQTFKELSREKRVNKITVRELCERSGLSKPTFYKYFEDMEDLVYRICYTEGRAALRKAETVSKGFEEGIVAYYNFALEQDYYYRSFKYDQDLQVLLYKSIYTSSLEYITERLPERLSPLDMDTRVSIIYYSAGCAHIFIDWIKGNMKEAPENLAASIMKAIPTPLLELVNFEKVF